MIRFGIEADRHEVMALWEESFGDTQEEIAEFFRCLAGEVRVLVWEEGGRILGQLCLLPVRLWSYGKAEKAEYIYAVATKAKARGRGICTRLLSAAASLLKEEGSCGVLVPEDGGLAKFYVRRGFSLCFCERIWEVEGSDEKKPGSRGTAWEKNRRRQPVLKPMPVSAYIKCRRDAFAGAAGVEPSGGMLEYAVSSFVREGGICASLLYEEKIYGVLCRMESGRKSAPKENALLIQEMTAKSREEAICMAQALLGHFDCKRALLRRSYYTCGLHLPAEMEKEGCFNLVLN